LLAELQSEYAKETTVQHSSTTIANRAADLFRKDQEGTTHSTSRIYFHHDGIFGVTNRPELARHVLERIAEQPTDGLLERKVFQEISSRSRAAAGDSPIHLTWFLDPWGYAEITRKPNADGPDTTWIKQEGFDIIGGVGGVISIAEADYDSEHHWFAYGPDAKEKAARMLAFSPLADWSMPDFVPADIGTLRTIGWNIAKAIAGYGSLFDTTWAEGEEGTFEAVLDDIRDEPDGPQVDLRNLLNLQRGPVIEITAPVSANDQQGHRVVYALNLSDAPTVAAAVKRMFEPDKGVTPTSVGESTMWVFQSQASGEPALLGPDLSGYVLGVAQGHLFIATDQSYLEKILAEPNSARLAEDETYKNLAPSVAARQPQNCIAQQISLASDTLGTGFGLWRGWANSFVELLFLAPGQLPKTPPAELVGQFASPGFGFVRESDDGWLFSEYVLSHSPTDSVQTER